MAKYECSLHGNFNQILETIHSGLMNKNSSISYEDGTIKTIDNINCAVRVYERYSLTGSNRVSLNITLIGKEEELFLTAITAGGSQAMFFKINTLGEESFLDCLKNIIEKLQ